MTMDLINNGFIYTLNTIKAADNEGAANRKIGYLNLLADMLAFYRKQWNMPMDWAYEELLLLAKSPAEQLTAAAIDAESRALSSAAARLAETAATLDPAIGFAVAAAACFRKSGDIARARAICKPIASRYPENHDIMSELFMCDVFDTFWRRDYYDLFADIHRHHQPRVYLEIGVATGKSLALARAATIALGVDPAFQNLASLVYHSPENTPQHYGMTSDDFFASRDVSAEMGRPHFDVAFIDGLHHFDQVLRDFINLEKFAGKESVILIHDCLPIHPVVSTRERSTAFWTGDVWKIIPCLKAVRPDLQIITLPVPPAGLAIVRNLDSSSKLLSRQYVNVVEQFDQLLLPEGWEDRVRMLAVETDESSFNLAESFSAGGWL